MKLEGWGAAGDLGLREDKETQTGPGREGQRTQGAGGARALRSDWPRSRARAREGLKAKKGHSWRLAGLENPWV